MHSGTVTATPVVGVGWGDRRTRPRPMSRAWVSGSGLEWVDPGGPRGEWSWMHEGMVMVVVVVSDPVDDTPCHAVY